MADNRNFVNKFANEGGGDIFVEDAKLSESTSTTTVTTEGVLLKGTDGAFYEIDKASLSEVIRAELGSILADNSKNNGTSVGKVPTLNSTGNALGASSLEDLASVLGVVSGDYSGDFNDAPINVTKLVAATSPANAPITGVLRGYLTTKSSFNYISQTYIEVGGGTSYNGAIFSRTYTPGLAWSDWQRIDNYGTSSLSELASALGDLLYVRTVFHGSKNAGETINLGNRYGIFFFGNAGTGSSFIYVKEAQGWSKIYGSSDLNIDNTTNIYTIGANGFTGTISQFGSSSYA